MTAKTDAWMPLWIGAYLADTQMLTTLQHGAYLLLLMAYWRERAALPDDDDALRAITKADRGEWKRLRPALVRFFKVENGVWWHKRVEQEMIDADARKMSAVAKAQAGGLALAEKRRKQALIDAPSSASSTPQALLDDVLGECPTPSPSSLRSEKKSRKRSDAPEVSRPDDVDEQVWGDWVQLRRDKKATVSMTVVSEARSEARKAGMTLVRFLAVWCIRGSQGLQAEWLRPDERASGETAYQRSARERIAEIHPSLARKASGAPTTNPMEILDGLIRDEPARIAR